MIYLLIDIFKIGEITDFGVEEQVNRELSGIKQNRKGEKKTVSCEGKEKKYWVYKEDRVKRR